MEFEKMLDGENTDSLYSFWGEYRKRLTEFIVDVIENYYIREKLRKTGKKRLYQDYNMEQIVEELGDKPVLGIWGAGGFNDIDIKLLSKYFRLVLIDDNLYRSEEAKERFQVSDCVCVDLKFWDITEEEYLMLEAMYKDSASEEEVSAYIRDIVKNMGAIDYSSLPKFDFSVAVGLVSQLNSRIVALAQVCDYRKNITPVMDEINEIAVERLFDVMNVMTKNMVLQGYECNTNGQTKEVTVKGSREMDELIRKNQESGQIKIFIEDYDEWNFMNNKTYLMKYVIYEE